MRRIYLSLRNKYTVLRNVLYVLLDIVLIILISRFLFVPSGIESLDKDDFIVICLAVICVSTLIYKLALRGFGGTLSSREIRLYEAAFLLAFVTFGVAVFLSAWLNFNFTFLNFVIAFLVIIINFQCTITCAYRYYKKRNETKFPYTKNIAIIGAGNAGKLLYGELLKKTDSQYHVYCFFDDDINKIGTTYRGVKIYGPIDSIEKLLKNSPVTEVILAIPSLSDWRRQEILELCTGLPYTLKILPDSVLCIEDENIKMAASIRSIKIEDLLGRSCVSLQNEETKTFLSDKVIMVTGGGGSIGSELCRQIAMCKPNKLIIVEIFENSAYLLKTELDQILQGNVEIRIEIASIRDEKRIKQIFNKYLPNIVFHAAAHKHVPLMEDCPGEAVKNNIFGTYNLIKLSALYGCDKFVMLSTDKAVNPTNTMGATKRYCEMMLQAMADYPHCKTEFVAVRFGNVLGSNGSVVQIFMNQIERGGPITLTDKRIIRYFMTISEAVSLVLKAGSMAHKSEIFVLDMGKPVKILKLAENLIALAGFKPYKEIDILETGLRPGEKLYEELLIIENAVTATSDEKIFIEKQDNRIKISDIEKGIKLLRDALETESDEKIVATLRKLVPTFKLPKEVNSRVEDINELRERAAQGLKIQNM